MATKLNTNTNTIQARVFECPKRFSTGREDVEDDEKPDSQVRTKTDGNVEKMRTHVRYEKKLQFRHQNSSFKTNTKYGSWLLCHDRAPVNKAISVC